MSRVDLPLRDTNMFWNGLRMSAREPASLSRANDAHLVVDHASKGWRLVNKKKRLQLGAGGTQVPGSYTTHTFAFSSQTQ